MGVIEPRFGNRMIGLIAIWLLFLFAKLQLGRAQGCDSRAAVSVTFSNTIHGVESETSDHDHETVLSAPCETMSHKRKAHSSSTVDLDGTYARSVNALSSSRSSIARRLLGSSLPAASPSVSEASGLRTVRPRTPATNAQSGWDSDGIDTSAAGTLAVLLVTMVTPAVLVSIFLLL